jgi:hypothetical protein
VSRCLDVSEGLAKHKAHPTIKAITIEAADQEHMITNQRVDTKKS